MLASQRQDRILADVRARGAVRVADLVVELDVSDMTIRRDIAELARLGVVRRVHGGAVDAHHTAHELDFAVKRTLAATQKLAIARAALAWISPGSSIALSAGSTAHLLAELIAADPALRPLTVVTNSLPVADTLHLASRRPGSALDVVLTGGVRTPSDALVGPIADAALGQLRVDRTFLGVHGLGPDGLTTPNLLEAQTDRALLRCASDVVVLADHSKWGVVGLARIAALDAVDLLISDEGLATEACAAAASAVGQLLLAPATASPQTPPPQSPTTERGAS
ncbi:DeoR/GlpR family DNA-binding transcription regulator [Pengzhenrongella sicca]|uniref:DeoR/GlpR transcriptional regulator n=1 Tax=Pengzhenrongella sicca TaxID=2819238 RepID=A0A8A4ZHK6_9MICO|nr:DeoR/GlpR family DNA-binding transcription regulator [Pengzhenrongella sicca]QTE29997.1 DeoR/GlpR transcriptional regulator [Pengzhenrongella sicca]